jgi:hypothetical protein
MKKLILVTSYICILISAGIGMAAAQDEVPAMITQKQADALAAVLRHQAAYRHDIDFAQQLSQFPPSRIGDLDPILATTGVHCVLPGKDESLHFAQYVIGSGPAAQRIVFTFTLSPAVTPGQGGTSIAELLRNRNVTQYWIWLAGANPQGKGKVYAFSSRTDSTVCEWVG